MIKMDLLSKQDCMDLAHTSCNSFYDDRKAEFEIIKNKEVPNNKDSIMLFYDSHLTALMCYNTLKSKTDTSMVWREVSYSIGKSKKIQFTEEWILIINCLKNRKS
tara:strand:- start:33 stop:347 length:315 start_codon:yes stop_codon:yes gene_type:complete